MFFRRKKKKQKKPSLGTITVLETQVSNLGPELARFLDRKYFDGRTNKELPWCWTDRVVSRQSDYSPSFKDGRVVKVESLIDNDPHISNLEILKRALNQLREL